MMGSGKSVLAGAQAQRAGLHVLSSDVIRKASAGVQPATPTLTYGEGLYTAERTETTYRQMFQMAESLLERDIRSCSTPLSSASATVSRRESWQNAWSEVLHRRVLMPGGRAAPPTRSARGTGEFRV